MNTKGKEGRYHLSTPAERTLMVVPEAQARADGLRSDDLLTELPEALVRRWAAATAALGEAEHEIARWVKYSGTASDKTALRLLIAELPTAEERIERRKKR